VERLLRELTHLFEIAADLVERTDRDPHASPEEDRGGAIGVPGLHAVYGVSVRVGPAGKPVVRRFGNIRQNARREPIIDDAREPLTDVFDEGDRYVIVAELPGATADAVHWRVRDARVIVIESEAPDRRYRKEIGLTVPVDETTGMSCFENGVLELRLCKQQPR
jgi:HSP20 family protein